MSKRLTVSQRDTLRVLSDGDWYDARECAHEFRRTFRSLVQRGLLKRRTVDGVMPEISITDEGLRLLKTTWNPHE